MSLRLFVWADRHGLPLEVALAAFVRHGQDAAMTVRQYVEDARRAGWSRRKVAADLRDAGLDPSAYLWTDVRPREHRVGPLAEMIR